MGTVAGQVGGAGGQVGGAAGQMGSWCWLGTCDGQAGQLVIFFSENLTDTHSRAQYLY